jgi:hypothetical protein
LTDTTAQAAIESAAAAIERLRAGYAARYGAVVFDVGLAVNDRGQAVLAGLVLMASQRDDAMRAAHDILGPDVVDGVVVLLDEDRGPWYEANGVLDVFSGPDGELATQVDRGDPPIRRLVARDPWWVVELADRTVGWCRPSTTLSPLAPAREPASTAAWRASYAGAWTFPPQGWRQAVERWLGTPYLWGGTTPAGVDCSGFVQRIVKDASGLGLPKHSVDQLRHGRRVGVESVAAGDLIYMTRRDDGVRHIALVVDSGPPIEVAHAGRERGVAIESLDSVLVRYESRGACRLGPDPVEQAT